MCIRKYAIAVMLPILVTTPTVVHGGTVLVFGSHASLANRLGVDIPDWGPKDKSRLPEKCPYFGGDGMYGFTFSHAFAKKFRKKGFTNLSLCMAMASEIKFDPQTGKRLPTFILADIPAVKRGEIESGTSTDQIPYDLPNCFRNAQPLRDCKLNFDMETGRRLTTRQVHKLKRGEIIGNRVRNRLLPSGHGYVLYNDGGAGSEASNDTVKIVLKKFNQ